MNTILISGITGFLGSNLAHALLKAGYKVVGLKRVTSSTRRIEGILDELVLYNVEKHSLSKPFEEHSVDYVIHTATNYGRANPDVVEIVESNVLFPTKLLQQAIRFNADTFFNTDTILPGHLNSYALSKRHFFEWAKTLAHGSKTKLCNIKLEHMYGPGDSVEKFTTYVFKSLAQNIPELRLTRGEQLRDFIHIDDVTSAYLTLLACASELGRDESFEVGSGMPVKVKEFVELAKEISGASTDLQFGALPCRENEIMSSCANCAALRKLGWIQKLSLRDGVRAALAAEGVVV